MTNFSGLKRYLDENRKRVDRNLLEVLGDDDSEIVKAMRHSLFSGGKRLRPILCIAAAEACGNLNEAVMSAALAIELVHTYSLIHDDLPAMDDDDMRRGKPTCHVIFGEALAVLAGDALLTLAFELLSASEGFAEKRVKAISILAKAAGYRGMIRGQVMDITLENIKIDETELERMHRLKTGAMIEASVVIGALLSGADDRQMASLKTYSSCLGLAFQVTDDILNVTGDPEKMGKSVGTDAQRGKNTYVSILGLKKSRQKAEELILSALHSIKDFDNRCDPLRMIARYVVDRKR